MQMITKGDVRLRQLGHLLRTKQAWMAGVAYLPDRSAWIVYVCREASPYLVPCSVRPTWKQYISTTQPAAPPRRLPVNTAEPAPPQPVPVIIVRHPGAVEWLRRQGIVGRVIAHASPDDVFEQDVIGVLPFHLAAVARSVTVIDLPQLRQEDRGRDLTPEEMDAAGARLVRYRVVEMPPLPTRTAAEVDAETDRLEAAEFGG